MATLEEIAKLAGVTKGTVSRVLNFDQTLNITEEKRAAVLSAAKELTYTPRKYTKSTKNVAFVHNFDAPHLHEDPTFIMISKLQETIQEDKKVKLYIVHEDELSNLPIINNIDGIIIRSLSSDRIKDIEQYTPNIVSILHRQKGSKGKYYPSIQFDEYFTPLEILENFWSNGHREIAYIGAIDDDYKQKGFSFTRKKSYIDFCTEHDVKPIILESGWDYNNGVSMIQELLQSQTKFTALLCANDKIAIGAIHELSKHGFSVPNDIEVCGFNNLASAEYAFPPLTTVNIHDDTIILEALDCLLTNIGNTNIPTISRIISTDIIYRNTTTNPT